MFFPDYWSDQLEAAETLEGAPDESEDEPASHWDLSSLPTFRHLDYWIWAYGHFIYHGSQILQVKYMMFVCKILIHTWQFSFAGYYGTNYIC